MQKRLFCIQLLIFRILPYLFSNCEFHGFGEAASSDAVKIQTGFEVRCAEVNGMVA